MTTRDGATLNPPQKRHIIIATNHLPLDTILFDFWFSEADFMMPGNLKQKVHR